MARMSTALNFHSLDGYTSLERVVPQPFMPGLFLPHQQGAWTPSRAPRQIIDDRDEVALAHVVAAFGGSTARWTGP